ncbi:MAG: hypothetical protein WEB53_12770 [Akkermansiaceae bacterium]
MEARKNLRQFLLPGLGVLDLDDLCVVLQDGCQACERERFLPQIVGFQAVGIRRITCAIVPALVEGEEPTGLALEFRAHPHFRVIDGEVNHATSETEELFTWIAIAAVLLHGILHRLFGEAVFQLESGNGQAVDERGKIE